MFQAGAGFRSPLPPDQDADRDGISDSEEAALAARYAPIVTLPRDDSTRPASLAWLSARLPVALGDRDDARVANELRHIPAKVRHGSDNPADWVTYVHVYPARDGGILVQYWFFYPYNDGPLWFDHETDWEHITVSLDANRKPLGVYAARHHDNAPGKWRAWDRLRKFDGTHPEILSAKGSHASYFDLDDVGWQDAAAWCEHLGGPCVHEQWHTWESGGLVNLGERQAPADSPAMHHRGLWGSAGILPGTSAPSSPPSQRGWCAKGGPACGNAAVL